jgi:hypothetical protein
MVNSGEAVTIRLRFTKQSGEPFSFDATAGPGYVWHCHLLEHEDNEMMRPFTIVSQGQTIGTIAIVAIGVVVFAIVLGFLAIRRIGKRRQKER